MAILGTGVAGTMLDNLHSAKGLNQVATFLFMGARYVEAVAALLASAAFLTSWYSSAAIATRATR